MFRRFPHIKIPVINIILILVILSTISLSVLFNDAVWSYHFLRRYCIATALKDSFLFFLPFVFIGPKKLWLLWIPVVLVSVLPFAEVIYARNFGDLIPGVAYDLIPTMDNIVFDSIKPSLKWYDIVFSFPIVALIFVFCLRKKINVVKTPRSYKLEYAIITILLIFITTANALSRNGNNASPEQRDRTLGEYLNDFFSRNHVQTKEYITDYGYTGKLVLTMRDAIPTDVELTTDDIVEINNFLEKQNSDFEVDGIISANKGKNLILIVVESWNTSTLTTPAQLEVMPNLKKLMLEDSCIFVPNVVPEVFLGRSSDGQLQYNTGLYPLRSEPFVGRFAEADYPSLAKALGYKNSIEFNVADDDAWRHKEVSKSFGYDKSYFNCGWKEKNWDDGLFKVAKSRIKEAHQPFFAQVLTLSMHDPYLKEVENAALNDTLLMRFYPDQRDRNYLKLTNLLDKNIGSLIEELKESDIYRNTVIAIIGDHEAREFSLSSALSRPRIPLIILNAGINKVVEGDIPQIDVFPTLLDVMGVENYIPNGLTIPYRGMGKSILVSNPLVDSRQAKEVSEKLIRGKYFSR